MVIKANMVVHFFYQLNKVLDQQGKYFSYFSMKTYVVGTH